MSILNFYALLGVSSTATQQEIKMAYRKLAKRYHPDKNPGSKIIEERFKEITEAYNVLSDEISRKKYDLKFFYSSNAQSEKRYNPGVKREQPRFKVKKERPPTAAEKRATRIIFSIVIVFVLLVVLMIILNPADEDTARINQMLSDVDMDPPPKKEEKPPAIMDADSPYDKIFGEGISVAEARNTITVTNCETSEVVVCLVEKGKGGRTIRNEYFGPGLSYKIVGIPNGTYYIKAYFGKHWNPDKLLNNGKVKGGFDQEIGFYRSDKRNNLFIVDQHYSGENLVYANYEIELKKILDDQSRRITAEEFFK